jgi:hypothetical protein
MSFNVVVKGFANEAEAEEFITWFSESGEQGMHEWFEVAVERGEVISCPSLSGKQTFPINWEHGETQMILDYYD